MTTQDSADERWVYENSFPYCGNGWSILCGPSTFVEARGSLFERLAVEVSQCRLGANNADRIHRLRNEVTGEQVLILGPGSAHAPDTDGSKLTIVDSGVEAVFTDAATRITGAAVERNKRIADAAEANGGTLTMQ